MNAQEKAGLKEQISLYLAAQQSVDSGVRFSRRRAPESEAPKSNSPLAVAIQKFIHKQADEETFSKYLLRIIRERGLRESDVYNSVFMDRTLFSKIRSDPEYRPSKRTAILLALALHLPLSETQELLSKAGYQLSHSDRADLIIEYFITHGNYNVLEIDEMLDEFGEPLLLKEN